MSEVGNEKLQRPGGWIPPGEGHITPLGDMISVHRRAAGHPVKPKDLKPRTRFSERLCLWLLARSIPALRQLSRSGDLAGIAVFPVVVVPQKEQTAMGRSAPAGVAIGAPLTVLMRPQRQARSSISERR